MNKGMVYVISGPSGSGKGTVVEQLKMLYTDMGVSVSATTREPRAYERDGVHYYFKTREEFERLMQNGSILEHTEYNGNLYGTLRSEAERIINSGKDLILEIEVEGAEQIKKLLGDECTAFMIIPPSAEELERRLRERGTDSDAVIRNRLERAREELKLAPMYDYVIINETGKSAECAETVLSIIKAEHQRFSLFREFTEHFFD